MTLFVFPTDVDPPPYLNVLGAIYGQKWVGVIHNWYEKEYVFIAKQVAHHSRYQGIPSSADWHSLQMRIQFKWLVLPALKQRPSPLYGNAQWFHDGYQIQLTHSPVTKADLVKWETLYVPLSFVSRSARLLSRVAKAYDMERVVLFEGLQICHASRETFGPVLNNIFYKSSCVLVPRLKT